MKKVGLVLLAVFAVFAVVLTAGCIDQPASDNPSLAINIEKTGITYNIGDTMDVILPSATEGYSWAVKNVNESLSVTEKDADKGYQCFAVKAADGAADGNYAFTLVYKKADEDAGIYEYTDILHVVKTDDEPIARSVFKFEGSEYTVTVGEKVTVSVNGNPTTGYQWMAVEAENEGLTVSEPEYKQNDAPAGMAGVPGVYTWTITADIPGAYYFTALYQRGWEDEPIGRIIVPICFTVE